ncbi:MAG: hypothetical protein WKF84_06310 [Pyrinomonadaceae bacterium]
MLEGKVVTCDALLTQREVAQSISAQGGDYVMIVKGNQPTLLADISDLFTDREPVLASRWRPAWIRVMGALKRRKFKCEPSTDWLLSVAWDAAGL